MTDEVERIKLAGQIDISCVQAFHTLKEIDEMIEIAKKYGFAAVFTLPAFSAHVAERLRDCKEIHTGGVVSFPGGGDTIEQKKRQAKELWETGCEEVDMVMNLTALKSQEFSYIKEELTAVREAIPTAILKVIIEAPHLTEAEIRQERKTARRSLIIPLFTGKCSQFSKRKRMLVVLADVTDHSLKKFHARIAYRFI